MFFSAAIFITCVSLAWTTYVFPWKRYNVKQGTTATTKVIASGSLMVTGNGSVVIDEALPASRSLLNNPDSYINVEFDYNEPAPPPCTGALPDEVDWELFFKHVHDTHLNPNEKKEVLQLKLEWRVATSRTVVWSVRVPS